MVIKIRGYTREDLLTMDIDSLRGLLHERTHHTIEIPLYRILNGKLKRPEGFGREAKTVLNIWKERGLPTDTPDLQWCIKCVEIADALNAGEHVKLDIEIPKAFSKAEMNVVKRLLYERRSIRQFTDKLVPEDMIREILYAGLMAPQGCNVDARRFIILQNPEEWKLVQSDIPIENGVMILVCQDMRVYQTLSIDKLFPHNIYFDAACAADHMCLMAHALGLGACWLTHREETQNRIRKYFGLPETFVSRCHLIVGWPDEAPIKPQRMSLNDAIIRFKRRSP